MSKILQLAGSNFCTDSGLLTATGAETVYDTTVIIPFSIDGLAYRKAAVTDGVTPLVNDDASAFTALAINEGCNVLWLLDAAGAVSVIQSDIGSLAPEDGTFLEGEVPVFRAVPDGKVPFAYMILTNGSTGSAFTIGASNWNQTGITVSIKNLLVLPERPAES